MSCASPGRRDRGPGHLCSVPQAVARAGTHLPRLESLQLGCCCHLLGWGRVLNLPPPRADLLSPGFGWRARSPRACSAEDLPRRRRSQQSRREAEGLFPRGALERSLQQEQAAGRLGTVCPSWRLTVAFAPGVLLPVSP